VREIYGRLRAARLTSDGGATAVEYALIVGAIALLVLIGALALGGAVDNPLNDSANCVGDLTQCPS
jgi:Flp pilus assembly pilin Flp